eukprot:1161659-Pelagomonas_calceolata.AAC.20
MEHQQRQQCKQEAMPYTLCAEECFFDAHTRELGIASKWTHQDVCGGNQEEGLHAHAGRRCFTYPIEFEKPLYGVASGAPHVHDSLGRLNQCWFAVLLITKAVDCQRNKQPRQRTTTQLHDTWNVRERLQTKKKARMNDAQQLVHTQGE